MQVFAGPMSESVPSSVASFAHRRSRHDSTASFTYFQEDDESPEWSDEEAVDEESDEENGFADHQDEDLEAGSLFSLRKKSSGRSRTSADDPLLARHESFRSDTRGDGLGGSMSQKLYIVTEDLTIVVAGFSTSLPGLALYITLCVLTLGIAHLGFRWLPRWRVRLIGYPSPLRRCSWVVIEVSSWHGRKRSNSPAKSGQNQWGEFTTHDISSQEYGRSLSTVFGSPEKEALNGYNYDDDPVLEHLRFLDYRYIRFCYHPIEDKFVLSNSWKDPLWTDVKLLRTGLDADERDYREQVFGKNMIEIQQKSIPQLLVDEVMPSSCTTCSALTANRLFIHFTYFRSPV